MLFLHIIACYFYSVTLENSEWVPPHNWLMFKDAKLFTDEWTPIHKYSYMFYTSLMFLGSNEIGPVNPNEMFVCFIILLISAMFSALLISDLVVLVTILIERDQMNQTVITKA